MIYYTDDNLKNLSFQAGLGYPSLNKIRDRKRAHYEPGSGKDPNIMVNSSTGFIETEFVTDREGGCEWSVVQCERKMEENRNSSLLGQMGSVLDSDSHQNSHQQPSTTTSELAIVANKSSRPKKAKRNTVPKVAKAKEPSQKLREFRRKWQDERDIIARIVQLGQKLGHPPTYLDLYCAGFEPAELDAISDLLQPLLASDEDAEVVPWVEAPLELVVA